MKHQADVTHGPSFQPLACAVRGHAVEAACIDCRFLGRTAGGALDHLKARVRIGFMRIPEA
jgi:hypothetical protein